MKKVALTIIGTLLIAGVSFAQSSNDYKARNHKLNSNQSKSVKETSVVIPMKAEISEDVYNYLARNYKFHKSSTQAVVVMSKSPINYDYRAMNHKLNKSVVIDNNTIDDTAITHN